MPETLRNRFLRLIDAVETMRISVAGWFLVLGSIIVIRHFLEQVSVRHNVFDFVSYLLHYPLAYFAPLLALTVVLAIMSGERVERVTRLMLFAWLLTLLPPVLDLLIGRGKDQPEVIGYLLVEPSQLGTAFVNLFNPFHGKIEGATSGIRLEAAVGCVAGAVYVFLKTGRLGRALATFVVVYATMFFFFTLPTEAVKLARLFGHELQNVGQLFFAGTTVTHDADLFPPGLRADLSMSLIELYVITPLLVVWAWLHDREKFRTHVSSITFTQPVYHVLLTLGGMVLGAKLLTQAPGLLRVTQPFDGFVLTGILLASFLAALAAQTLGRLHAALAADGASPEEIRELRTVAVVESVVALLIAASSSWSACSFAIVFLGTYYLYYARPFQLSRLPVLSGIFIGIASLFSLEMGYTAYAGAATPLWTPRSVVVLAVAVPALIVTSMRVWSTAADPSVAPGQRTLGSLLGGKSARVVAWILMLAALLLPGLVLRLPALIGVGAIAAALAVIAEMKAPANALRPLLLAITIAFLLASLVLGVPGSPVLRSELTSTTFAAPAGTGQHGEVPSGDRPGTAEQDPLTRGVGHLQAGELERAIPAFMEALETDPESRTALTGLGVSHFRLGQFDRAVPFFERVAELDPNNVDAHVNLGMTYAEQNRPEAAAAEFERALELDPANAAAGQGLEAIRRGSRD
jgi:hypothetical protein